MRGSCRMGHTCHMQGTMGRREMISRGNTSEVWAYSPTTVVKLLRHDIPTSWAHAEATITTKVHEAGLPVPGVVDTVEVDGRAGIVFERVDGLSMWDQMKSSPGQLHELTEALVRLQSDVHATTPIAGLPDLMARTRAKVSQAKQLSALEQAQVQALLDDLPSGSALCHGDLHPRNIIIAKRGMVIVDWFDAANGYDMADFVRSSLLMRPTGKTHLEGAPTEFIGRLHKEYARVLASRFESEPLLDKWEVVLAVARMAEPVPQGELTRIWTEWRDNDGSDGSSRLIVDIGSSQSG